MNRDIYSITLLLGLFVSIQTSQAQRFTLFPMDLKTEHPSVVYDFLETYLYEIDSLQSKGVNIDQRLRDDKVVFIKGSASTARGVVPGMAFNINKNNEKFYEVFWTNTQGNVILDLAFPMHYELLLGKPKIELEKDLESSLTNVCQYKPYDTKIGRLILQKDGCLMTDPVSNYYVETLNTATYYSITESGDTIPVFTDNDKWHSAANLFHGMITDITDYTLDIEQNLYGFKKKKYRVSLQQWLSYCQSMKMNIYFAIEEEREDALKALLIAQNLDLGFNHMLSFIIPNNFVNDKKTVFKVVLNAYIPTQNVKDLYQQYVDKPKKRI